MQTIALNATAARTVSTGKSDTETNYKLFLRNKISNQPLNRCTIQPLVCVNAGDAKGRHRSSLVTTVCIHDVGLIHTVA